MDKENTKTTNWFGRHRIITGIILLAVVAFLIWGFVGAAQRQEAIATLQGRTGMTAEEVERAEAKINDISNLTGLNFEEVAVGFGPLYSVLGKDVDSTSEVVELLAKATQITRENFREVVPVIVELFQKSNVQNAADAKSIIGTLFQSVQTNSTTMKDAALVKLKEN